MNPEPIGLGVRGQHDVFCPYLINEVSRLCLCTLIDQVRDDEGHQHKTLIRALSAKLAAIAAVCRDREAELLALKGPCSTSECELHDEHSGPCRIKDQPDGRRRTLSQLQRITNTDD